MESIRGLKRHLIALRKEAEGKTFSTHAELFKDIEGVKAQIAFYKAQNKQA